jgi:hypothetical protein
MLLSPKQRWLPECRHGTRILVAVAVPVRINIIIIVTAACTTLCACGGVPTQPISCLVAAVEISSLLFFGIAHPILVVVNGSTFIAINNITTAPSSFEMIDD